QPGARAHGRAAVRPLELAGLPLATEHPQRIRDAGFERVGQKRITRTGLQPPPVGDRGRHQGLSIATVKSVETVSAAVLIANQAAGTSAPPSPSASRSTSRSFARSSVSN